MSFGVLGAFAPHSPKFALEARNYLGVFGGSYLVSLMESGAADPSGKGDNKAAFQNAVMMTRVPRNPDGTAKLYKTDPMTLASVYSVLHKRRKKSSSSANYKKRAKDKQQSKDIRLPFEIL
jgi:hypothetical protein